jgi:hypothetical protein
MPFHVPFVRDHDIPDLAQDNVCDLGLVGRNVPEEERLQPKSCGAAARQNLAASFAGGGSDGRAPDWRATIRLPTIRASSP